MTDEHPAFTANHGAPRYPMPPWYTAVVEHLKRKPGSLYTAPADTQIPIELGTTPGFLEGGTLGPPPSDTAFRWSGIVRAGEQEHAAVFDFDATGFVRNMWFVLTGPPRRRGLETRSARHRRNRLRRKRAARKRNR